MTFAESLLKASSTSSVFLPTGRINLHFENDEIRVIGNSKRLIKNFLDSDSFRLVAQKSKVTYYIFIDKTVEMEQLYDISMD